LRGIQAEDESGLADAGEGGGQRHRFAQHEAGQAGAERIVEVQRELAHGDRIAVRFGGVQDQAQIGGAADAQRTQAR